ncbi:MAG: alpha-L-fucosidase [Eubacteriales bacterium]|nr:alpha-L-fucosidase [Eubacteriales bacterium]
MLSIAKKASWWSEGKFGLFVHWGLYALLAGEYRGKRTHNIAEWIMHDLKIPRQEYEKLAGYFQPSDFNANAVVRMARDAGMRYLVFTAKHHDGFAMFDSKASPYNIVAATPYGRDPAEDFRRACDKYGLKLCFYYSQAQDWHHPGGIEERFRDPNPRFREYLDEKCIPQLKELLTNYGDIGLIWFDTPMRMTRAESSELTGLVRSIQPDCLISGRVGHGLGDYMTTGDNFLPLLPYPKPFEVPATINHTWGYSRFDTNWKSAGHLIRSLVKTVSRGGNYLLNIGPDAYGRVPEDSVNRIGEIGAFMRENGEALYGASPVPIYPYDVGDWCLFTAKPHALYLHLLEKREDIYLLGIKNKPLRATLLIDGQELPVTLRTTGEGDASWRIPWPKAKLGNGLVIRVDIEEPDVLFEPIRD